jgi:hypothetical protein
MNVSMRTGLALAIGFSIAAVVGCRDEGPASSVGTQAAGDRADLTNAPRRMNSLKVSDRASAGGSAASSATTDAAPTVNGTPAPTVNGSPARRDAAPTITQSTNRAANRQSLTARAASGPFAQRQDGSGNTQVLNVEGTSSAGVTQRQSGSGNFQSMNIGATDNPSIPGTSAGSRP